MNIEKLREDVARAVKDHDAAAAAERRAKFALAEATAEAWLIVTDKFDMSPEVLPMSPGVDLITRGGTVSCVPLNADVSVVALRDLPTNDIRFVNIGESVTFAYKTFRLSRERPTS